MSASQNQLDITVLLYNDNGDGVGGTAEVVAICSSEPAKEDLHRLGSLEGKPRVGAVVRELARQTAKEETSKHASISRTIGITLAVSEAPCREVIWGKICRKEAVATC